MYLSKLEIFGFKSFANKAAFKFDSGLTGIIGPNGCGKSNIVDAIRWVLGEQRPRILRCDRMENLIFNGTATRKPLNLAEISMTIENNRNVLPSEYTELKITRRLHRSGDSEYLINNEQVRLMDIVNLFTDTGMGADAYSVIELKMVEQILSDNAEERRRLFEEAAGIKKYKARRRSAFNKLDTTTKELTRLDDLISEVQRNVNSLSRQVGKARRYHEYKNDLKDSELLLSHLRINSYRTELGPLKTELEQVGNSRDTLGKEVHVEEAALEKMQAEFVELEQSYRRLSSDLYQKDEGIRQLQSNKQLKQQRIDSLKESISSFQREVEFQREKIEQLDGQRDSLQGQGESNTQEISDAQSRYRESANKQLEVESRYEKVRNEYQRFVQENLQDLQQSGDVKENYQRLQLEKESIAARLNRSRETMKRYDDELKRGNTRLEELETDHSRLKEDQSMYTKELEHLETTVKSLLQRQQQLREEIARGEGELEKVRSKRDFLDNLINSYEGFSESVQFVMSNKGKYNGIVDTLANLVDCDVEYRPALESFLAGISNYLVVEETDTAREIFGRLRSDEKGRMTVVPMSMLKKLTAAEGPASTASMQRFRELVNCPQNYRPLFDYLFQSVYLVDDLENAIAMRENHPTLTYVTRDGEILGDWGQITGGTVSKKVNLIGRKERYEKLCKDFETLEGDIVNKKAELEKTGLSLQEKDGKRGEFEELLRGVNREMTELDKQVNQQRYEVGRLTENSSEISSEMKFDEDKSTAIEADEKKLLPQIRELEAKVTSYREQEGALKIKQQQGEEGVREITRITQELQITYLNLISQEKELSQKIQFMQQGITEAQTFIMNREEKIGENNKETDVLSEETVAIDAKLELAFKDRDAAEELKNNAERQFQELRGTIHSSEAELKKKQRLWNQARERMQEVELRVREIQVKLAGHEEQLQENYGKEALEFDIKEMDPSTSIHSLQEKIDTTRRKLEALGDVNPLAIKEHEKEKERLDFNNAQRDDLLSARDQLLETIDQLNTTARKQFIETLEQIQINFQRVFSEFFPGGTAELALLESRDPLEANIDISVNHKGKKLQTLTLMSAGEKTLTAISLLFAIYLVKPSPFCILDEVDAPLDDVNVSRLTGALNIFASETQFLLVTHNKKTMEATDALYGITMEEQGVSKVVSVKFD
ncbi:MAG: chromosome segregation protein SMC [Calditrichia bacterium]